MVVTTPGAGSVSASATATTLGLVGLFLGAHFRAPVRDQLVGQTDARRQVREHAARPLYRGSTSLSRRLPSFRRMGHDGHGSGAGCPSLGSLLRNRGDMGPYDSFSALLDRNISPTGHS
jgi:hypothetical protein